MIVISVGMWAFTKRQSKMWLSIPEDSSVRSTVTPDLKNVIVPLQMKVVQLNKGAVEAAKLKMWP